MAKVFVTKVRWLCDTISGLMEENQGVLYISPVVGLGMTYPFSKTNRYVGMNPKDVPSKRYQGNKATDSYGRVVVYQQDDKTPIAWDDLVRAKIHERHEFDKVAYPFDAYNKFNNPAPSGNTEALVNFDFAEESPHWTILDGIINEVFGLGPKVDIRKMWIPRDAGTPYGQDLMVEELASVMQNHQHAGFNGHTGLAKTMIVSAALQSKVFPIGGRFILFTSPIGDTLDDVKENFAGFYYPGSDRSREVVVYTEKDLSKKSIKDMEKEAHKQGKFVVLALTVQDLRYQDDSDAEVKELREKYEDLLTAELDYYVRDEVQTNYGGPVTSQALSEIAKKTRLVDTSASLNRLVDLYNSSAILDRGIFWALQWEEERGTPHIHIETLTGLDFASLDSSITDVYNEEDGWSPAKMTEVLPNGQLKSLMAIDYILSLQYINIDDKEMNPLSIINDTDLPYESRRVGLHVFPEGVKGTTAQVYLIKLADSLNSMIKWNKGKAIFVTPYDYQKHIRNSNRSHYKEVIEDLLEEFEHVIILTHQKWTVGSNIPPMAHVVEWNGIKDPYNHEQLFPGRCYRLMPWKSDIKVYCLAPGISIELSVAHLATVSAKLRVTNPNPKDLLKNISFSHYVKGAGVIKRSFEDVFAKYNDTLLERAKSAPPLAKIAACLVANDLASLQSADIDTNNELNKGGKTGLTDPNGAKTFQWQDTNGKGKSKGKPKTLSPVELAKKINSVMMEVPAFAVLNKLFIIEDAINHWAIEKMFGKKNVELLLGLVKYNPTLRNVMQGWLTDIHQAYQALPFEELHDYIFKNTKKKKEAGLVFISNNSAKKLVEMFVKTFKVPKSYNGTMVVENALSGSWPFYLQKHFKNATILCCETHDYYKEHLNSMGFNVIDKLNIENLNLMKQIKYWMLNPPYQKDAEGQNDEANKQGSFWFGFVKEVLTSPASTADAKILVVSPKSVFGAGGFGSASYKVSQIREHAEFVKVWPDLSSSFPGIGIEICGYALDKEKTDTTVQVDGYTDTIEIDGSAPTPFHVSPTASKVLKNCWSIQNLNFSEKIVASDTDAVLRVNGGRYKLWKKTFVGFNKDTDHNQQGAIIDPATIPGFQSAVKSILWEYIFKVLGGEKGNSVTGLMKFMPVMQDMTKSYSDAEWFSAFGITAEMQTNIVQYLKDYK